MWAPIARKLAQLRDAQRAGQLNSDWDPVDVLALVSHMATTWAAQPELDAAAAEQATDPSNTARRAALIAAVGRLFPARH